MFKKLIKIVLFIFVVFVFCNFNGQVSYARKGGNKPNTQVKQKSTNENSELPTKWKPNSELKKYNNDGNLKQTRTYGPDGRAMQDIDYEHGGPNHKFPHTHDWDWSAGDDNPRKKKGIPLPGAKKLPPKQKNKKNSKGQNKKISPLKISDVAKETAVWGTAGTIVYFMISEGSRIVFPIRNLIPVL